MIIKFFWLIMTKIINSKRSGPMILQNWRAPFLACSILYHHIKSNWTFISAILTSKFPFFDKKFWQSCDLDWRKSSVAAQKRGFFLDALSKANPIFRFGQPPVKFHWKAFVSTVFVVHSALKSGKSAIWRNRVLVQRLKEMFFWKIIWNGETQKLISLEIEEKKNPKIQIGFGQKGNF